jgi:pimeloyl-ACP methyl ester carboxylesterase
MPYISINQHEIFYFDNKMEGTPLLFIHGWLGSSLEWAYQLYHFNFKKHIILLDLPGFGKSDKPNINYTIEYFTKQVLDFLKALEYNEIILIGHSFGGIVSQNITIQRPRIVKKLILISTSAALSSSIKERFLVFWVKIGFKLFYTNFLRRIIEQIIPSDNREFNKLYQNTLKLPKSLVLNTFKNMNSKFDLKPELDTISQPTLIIYGTRDKIISKSMAIDLNDSIPNSELNIIENGSHRVMYNNYASVNELIEEFVNK